MRAHSCFSLGYGILKPEELITWALEHGHEQLLLTDINHTGSGLSFVRAAQQQGLRPLLGVELRNELTLIAVVVARNNSGFQELNAFLTAHLLSAKQFALPLPNFENCWVWYPLQQHPSTLRAHEYIAVQASQIVQWQRSKALFPLAKYVADLPMTFRHKRDHNTHRLLRAISSNCLLSKLPQQAQAPPTQKLYTAAQCQDIFAAAPELLINTQALLANCSSSFAFGEAAKPQQPQHLFGSKAADLQRLQELCAEGLSYRYATITDEIISRIEMEIDIIAQKNYLSYFLITHDFTSYARSKGYFYVGRGSGANSIVAYLLRITDVDPLELDLYFERFINLYRKNPPDFDIDFSWRDRDDVVRYIFERYPNAAWLCTYSTFQYRACIHELSKVFGLPAETSKMLSRGKGSLAEFSDLGALILRYAKYIEGLPSHLSVHAGGIIISEKPLSTFAACFLPPKGYPCTQFSMLEAEDIGLYKFDVLSQRGLGKITEALQIIQETKSAEALHDIHDISYLKQDPKIAQFLRKGWALGCFYVESPAMRMLLIKLQVDNYLALVAASSIIRPGVSQSGMMREYILRHRDVQRRQEVHPLLLAIMPDTYGVMVYQEDVIKVAHYLAGLSLAEADVLRRGMSGKFRSRSEFLQVKNRFLEACAARGHNPSFSADIWRQIESFAGYAFSKGHSASYAVESYQSLYLKAHFPLAYLTACINNFGGYYRTEIYVHEARRFGAQIEAPCINEGGYSCVLKGQRLLLGFNLVAGLEAEISLKINAERTQNGPYIDLEDLLKRIYIPLEQLSILIRIDALRSFQQSRKALLWQAHFYQQQNRNKASSNELFEVKHKKHRLPALEEHPLECAFEQFELLGFPLCDPFSLLAKPLPSTFILAKDFPKYSNKQIQTFGYLVSIKQTKTSKGETMSFGTFLDPSGDFIDTVHFPEIATNFPFYGKGIYHIRGKITEEYAYFTLEVSYQEKLPFAEDVRLAIRP
ncbi:MAG: DNA polymerase III subunit alpha [Flavobacteriales bacterium]